MIDVLDKKSTHQTHFEQFKWKNFNYCTACNAQYPDYYTGDGVRLREDDRAKREEKQSQPNMLSSHNQTSNVKRKSQKIETEAKDITVLVLRIAGTCTVP